MSCLWLFVGNFRVSEEKFDVVVRILLHTRETLRSILDQTASYTDWISSLSSTEIMW